MPLGVTFKNIDRKRIRQFVISVIWRISISSSLGYYNIQMGDSIEQIMRAYIKDEKTLTDSKFVVTLSRLRDSSPEGFTIDELREFIYLPIGRRTSFGLTVMFIAAGFVFELFVDGVPRRLLKRNGVIAGRSQIFLAPYCEFLHIPEVLKHWRMFKRNKERMIQLYNKGMK